MVLLDARYDPETRRRQTLPGHCRSTATLSSAYAAPLELGAPAYLAALLHDFGKARQVFQAYLHETDAAKKRALQGKINHSAAGAQWLYNRFDPKKLPSNNPDRKFSAFTLEVLLLVICGHHSGLPDCLTPDGKNALRERVAPKSDIGLAECERNFFPACATIEEIDALWGKSVAQMRQFFFRLPAPRNPKEEIDTRHFALGLAVRYLSSCLIDADRYDAFCFAADKTPVEEPLAERFWQPLQARLEERLRAFPQDTPLAKLRGEIADACQAAAACPPGAYRLLAPTGNGKTLSSLRFALQHALLRKERPVKRIFYVIPYTTILDQTAQELRKALGDQVFILEHHSNVLPDETADADELETRELYQERWNAPIILTTTVQFLNTLFAGSNSCARRMHRLADAVFIFDEIQALPLKCTYLFNAACNFLTAFCGATIVLCTATQPNLPKLEVPLYLAPNPDILPHCYAENPLFQRVQIADTRSEFGGFTTKRLAAFTLERAAENPSLLCILNTKSAARQLYLALREQIAPDWALYHLSTSMCAAHRIAILEEIKASKAPRKLCVSTQLIEAGIDISFACVIRFLAGLDSIAQAAGRCNRHGEFSAPRTVYIVENQAETLKFLPDIRTAQEHGRRILACAEDFAQQLLCSEAIARYYDFYYADKYNETIFPYPITKKKLPSLAEDSSLFDLLSQNQTGCKARTEPFLWTLKQAFATAGQLFADRKSVV